MHNYLVIYVFIGISWIEYGLNGEAVAEIRGSNKFLPCSYRKETGGYGIICDSRASERFTRKLPIIQSDGAKITSFWMHGHAGITHCEAYTFQAATGQSRLRRIEILNTGLTRFQLGCFAGLDNLEQLVIRNAEWRMSEQASMDLFRELQHLRKLHELTLHNVDLSGGIPNGAFGHWATNLRKIWFGGNHLTRIADEAFSFNTTSLEEFLMERQANGSSILENSATWGATLTSLKKINFTSTPISFSENMIVNFSDAVNQKLTTLVFNNCSLTRLCRVNQLRNGCHGLVLAPDLANGTQELYIDHNRFQIKGQTKTTLDGLYDMTELRVLSLRNNHVPLYTLPRWGHETVLNKLRVINVERSGLKYLGPRAFPATVEVLHVSANPIRYVDPKWLHNLHGLRELHMNQVRLAAVNIGGKRAAWNKALHSVTASLRLLSLAHCQLTSDMFGSTEEMGDIKMNMPLIDLNKFKQLRTLILDRNNLTYFPINMTNELANLETISVVRNQVNMAKTIGIVQGNPQGKRRLLHIDLRYNRLRSLDRCELALGFDQFLENLLPLSPVWLGENNITDDRNGNDGTTLKELIKLGLTGNSMMCDCRLAWLSRYVVSGNNPQSGLDFMCADMGRWKGRLFNTLRPEDLYAVDHALCRRHPDIYGSPIRPYEELTPCHLLTVPLVAEERQIIRLLQEPSNMTRHIEPVRSSPSNLTIAAFTMLIIAGIVSLCFIIVSTVIIVKLCLRYPRMKRCWQPRGKKPSNSACRPGSSKYIKYSAKRKPTKVYTVIEDSHLKQIGSPSLIANRTDNEKPHNRVANTLLKDNEFPGKNAIRIGGKRDARNAKSMEHLEYTGLENMLSSEDTKSLGELDEILNCSKDSNEQTGTQSDVGAKLTDYQRILPWRSQKPHTFGTRIRSKIFRKRRLRSNAVSKKNETIGSGNLRVSTERMYKRPPNYHTSRNGNISQGSAQNWRRIMSPALPKPLIVLKPNPQESQSLLTDYLPMSGGCKTDDQYLQMSPDFKIDDRKTYNETAEAEPSLANEYIQPTEVDQTLRSDQTVRRRPSKSAEDVAKLAANRKNVVQLSDNLYLLPDWKSEVPLKDYGDMPLPPPPPPPPQVDVKDLLKRKMPQQSNITPDKTRKFKLPPLAVVRSKPLTTDSPPDKYDQNSTALRKDSSNKNEPNQDQVSSEKLSK